MTARLVIKLTVGTDALERCAQALSVAATAASSGVPVHLWLTGEASWLGLPGRAEVINLEHSPAFSDLLATIIDLGTVTVCSQCAARRNITPEQLLDKITISGAASFVEQIMEPETKALVY